MTAYGFLGDWLFDKLDVDEGLKTRIELEERLSRIYSSWDGDATGQGKNAKTKEGLAKDISVTQHKVGYFL